MDININGASCRISQWELSKLLASEKAMIDGKSKAGFLDAVRQSGIAKKIINDKSGYQEGLKPLLEDYVKRGAFVVKKGKLKFVKNQLLAARTDRQQERNEINSMRSSWQAIRGSVVEIDKRSESRQATCARLSNQLKSLNDAISNLHSQGITVLKSIIDQRDAIQKKLDEQMTSIETVRKNCRFFQENVDASMALKNQELSKFKQENDTINKGFNWIISTMDKKLGVEEDHSIITDLDDEATALQNTLNDFKKRAEELQATLPRAKTECKAYGGCIETCRSKIKTMCDGRKRLLDTMQTYIPKEWKNDASNPHIQKINRIRNKIEQLYLQVEEQLQPYDNLKENIKQAENFLNGKGGSDSKIDLQNNLIAFQEFVDSEGTIPEEKSHLRDPSKNNDNSAFSGLASRLQKATDDVRKSLNARERSLDDLVENISKDNPEVAKKIRDFLERSKGRFCFGYQVG